MPKGHKLVTWTPENDAKLFKSVLAVHPVQFDYSEIAKAFGDDIPSSCIRTRLTKLRAGSGRLGKPSNGTPPKKTTSNPKQSAAQKRKLQELDEDDESMSDGTIDDEAVVTGIEEGAKTPNKQTANAKKMRISPRHPEKKDYKKVEDPFAGQYIKTEDGENLFEKTASESEDSHVSGGIYRGGMSGEKEVGV